MTLQPPAVPPPPPPPLPRRYLGYALRRPGCCSWTGVLAQTRPRSWVRRYACFGYVQTRAGSSPAADGRCNRLFLFLRNAQSQRQYLLCKATERRPLRDFYVKPHVSSSYYDIHVSSSSYDVRVSSFEKCQATCILLLL